METVAVTRRVQLEVDLSFGGPVGADSDCRGASIQAAGPPLSESEFDSESP